MERDEAFARIRQWGDPVLRTRCAPVDRFDAGLARQAAEMTELMEGADGAGLAAPQVGLPIRLLVYRPTAEGPVRALANPEVEWASEEQETGLEGCLSLGRSSVAVEVPRAVRVRVRAQDLAGEAVEVEAEGRHARVLQHEVDHLDGVLMLERASKEQRREALRALREGRPYFPPAPPQPEPDADAPSPAPPARTSTD